MPRRVCSFAAGCKAAGLSRLAAAAAFALLPACALAQTPWWRQPLEPQQLSLALRILFALAVLSLAPALLIMLTSFTRIIVVLAILRNALSTQQTPPNFVLISLALFLTFFIMAPVAGQIQKNAVEPYIQGKISYSEALDRGLQPLRSFMLKQTRQSDLELFLQLAGLPRPKSPSDIPMHVLMPSFLISELRTAFEIGFVLYLPFVIIDLVVSSVLMSMGMLMLPPVMISLPIKILLFILVDGWHLLAESLVRSFH